MAISGTTVGSVLEVDGVRRRFGERQALDGLSFAVAPGRIFGFLGPNGAGKTTCMRGAKGGRASRTAVLPPSTARLQRSVTALDLGSGREDPNSCGSRARIRRIPSARRTSSERDQRR